MVGRLGFGARMARALDPMLLALIVLLMIVAPGGAAVAQPASGAAGMGALSGSFAVTGASPAGVSLAWPASTSLLFASYGVMESSNGGSSWTQVDNVTNASAATYYVSGLAPGLAYDWKIREYDVLSYSDSASVAYTQPAVATLTGSAASSTSAALNWTNHASYGGNVSFGAYAIWESANGGSMSRVGTITSRSTTTDTITGLATGTNYTFQLETTDTCSGAANCNSTTPGSSTYSNFVNVTTASTSHPSFVVSFDESGLAAGTSWSVSLAGATNSSSGTSIQFTMPNGTFSYTVGSVAGYTSSPSSGSVTVSGAATSASVAFNAVAAAKYPVSFDESGLPSGTSWSVSVSGASQSSTVSNLSFSEPNGSHSFSVGSVSGYIAHPSSGSVTVAGTAVVVVIDFSAQAKGNYSVTFSESGLPISTSWSVALSGSTLSSTGTSIVFSESNGSYSFAVGVPSGYSASPSSGSVSVSGAAAVQTISCANTSGGGGGSSVGNGSGGSGTGGSGSNSSGGNNSTGNGTGGGSGPQIAPPKTGSIAGDLVDALPAILLLLVILSVALRARANRKTSAAGGATPPGGPSPEAPSPPPLAGRRALGPAPVARPRPTPRAVWDEEAEPVRTPLVHPAYIREDEKFLD